MNRTFTIILGLTLFHAPAFGDPKLIEKERKVEASPPPRQPWVDAKIGRELQANELLAAKELSRGVVQLSQNRHLRIGPNSRLRILRKHLTESPSGLEIQKGEIYLHSREKWKDAVIKTRALEARPNGTQFVVKVGEDGTTTFTVIEGTVDLFTGFEPVRVEANEQATTIPGQRPKKTAVIDVRRTIQWCLYYPAVLNLDEMTFNEHEKKVLKDSFTAYRQGDLLNALDSWPKSYKPSSNSSLAYRTMVILSVGDIIEARRLLSRISADTPEKNALTNLLSAVTEPNTNDRKLDLTSSEFQTNPTREHFQGGLTSMEWLSRSYLEQSSASRNSLTRAYDAARNATLAAPNFGFAQVRLAELEFSFGRNSKALSHLALGIQQTPRNPQAWTLTGFIQSDQNEHAKAAASFQHAIGIDSALGNAWLGLGLTKIKQGDLEAGHADIRTSVALEPNRSSLHSYLGKSANLLSGKLHGLEDLDHAKTLDSADPTPWLYSAILNQKANRPSQAIKDLEKSKLLNDNRRLYRSSFLLDQDQSVRSANLASVYHDLGMTELAVREATRAVESDYTNASSHLFLANSFDALRDPSRVELRHETPWFHELLMANLLSPVGGGPLSQFVSQQEYSKLLNPDGFGSSVNSEWRSDSEFRSTISTFGTFENTSFGIDAHFRDHSGDRFNSDDQRLEIYAQLKHQFSPDDIVYFLGKWQDQETGDTFRTFDHNPLAPGFRFEERQEPGLLLGGWNHRWRPGSHTLFLGGRLSAHQKLSDPNANQLLLNRDASAFRPGFVENVGGFDRFTNPALRTATPPSVSLNPDFSLNFSPALLTAIDPFLGSGNVTSVSQAPFAFETERDFTIYSGEIKHIETSDEHTILLGGRYQKGQFDTETKLDLIRPNFTGGFATPAAQQKISSDFDRISLYAYDFWSPTDWLTLIGGISWDRIEHPKNFRNPPVSSEQIVDEEFSTKLGFTLSPSDSFTIRGLYAEALGGITFDESVTLEPVQLAGFSQAYRTVLSESLAGSVEAPRFKTWGLSTEGKIGDNTWWGARIHHIKQDVDRTIGSFDGYDLGVFPLSPAFFPGSTSQELNYEEQAFELTFNHLIGEQFSIGARYRLTDSKLHTKLPEISTTVLPEADQTQEATLHHATLFGVWNSPSGLYGRLEGHWYHQDIDDPSGGLTRGLNSDGDDFLQANAFLGYRFWDSNGDISLGVLNIFDQDYNLSPLNPYSEIARERTAVIRCRLNF